MRLDLRPISTTLDAGDARHRWTERRGLTVTLREADLAAAGEAAPLPGRSTETLAEVERSLRALDAEDLAEPALVARLPSLPASARFALEVALLGLAARRKGPDLAREAPLVSAVLVELLEGEALARTFGDALALKVKVGRPGREEDEARALLALRRATDLPIRADANGALPDPWRSPVVRALVEIGAELLEEPCALDRLLAGPRLPLPIALDESVALDPGASLDAVGGVARALVLKPALLGLGESRRLATGCLERGGRAIVSHAYDPPLAFAACVALALRLAPSEIHGLAPYPGLERWAGPDGPVPVPPDLVRAAR